MLSMFFLVLQSGGDPVPRDSEGQVIGDGTSFLETWEVS